MLVPYAPLKITKQISYTSTGSYVDNFEILDEKGVKYRFGQSLSGSFAIETGESGRSGWMVTDIISPTDPSNRVSFNYASRGEHRGNRYDQYIMDDDFIIDPNNNPQTKWCLKYQGSGSNYEFGYESYDYATWITSEITFKAGKVKFILNSDKMVEKMEIRDSQNNLIRYIKFNITTSSDFQRKLLSNVQFYDSQNRFIHQYSFQYHSGDIPLEDGPGGNARDYWGFYNGAVNNNSLVPMWSIPASPQNIVVGNANREANDNTMKSLVLERITYPTGGSTLFDFDAHYYIKLASGLPAMAGGLRIKKIINFDADGQQKGLKTYKYGENESGYGIMDIEPTVDAFYFKQFGEGQDNDPQDTYYGHGSFRRRIYTSEPVLDIAPNGSSVIYPEVTEYFGDEFNNTGKIKYTFDHVKKYWLYDPNYEKMHFAFLKDWNTGQLISKEIYKNKGVPNASDYEIVHQTYLEYYEEHLRDSVRGLLSYRYKILQDCVGSDVSVNDPYFNNGIYSYADFNVVSGEKRLKSVTEKEYTPAGPLSSKTEYVYDNSIHIQPTKTKTTNSKGETISTELKYPHDFAGQQPYSDMVDTRHIWSPVIEESTYKNATQFLQSSHTPYKDWGNSIIAPERVVFKRLNQQNAWDIRVRYHSYDNQGNITSVSKDMDVRNSYLWGYNKAYPIAQAINADANEIFFSGVEERGWDGLIAPEHGDKPVSGYDNTVSRSGKYSARIDKPTAGEYYSHSDTKLNISLTADTKYKLSGWVYSNGPSADIFLFMYRQGETFYYSEVDHINTTVTGRWVYIEKEINVPYDMKQLNVRIDNNGGGTVWFDDIRLHPTAAQMTTYTYEPLVGMTSQTDINNNTMYYEYDGLGRLLHIRDKERNILKKFCYNYQGQPEECSLNTSPVWVATGQTRCQPCSLNTSYTTNIQQYREVDNNPYSPTYQSVERWVDDGPSSSCSFQDVWQNVSPTQIRCETDANGQNTGNQVQRQVNLNPCSSNTERWVVIGTNTAACPLPQDYARLSYENTMHYASYSSADIQVSFYANSQGTTPTTVTGLDVHYASQDYCSGSGSYVQSCSGTSQVLEYGAWIYYLNDNWYCPPGELCPSPDCYVDWYLESGTGYSIIY